jgi:serine/threonine-protein kinase RsbT
VSAVRVPIRTEVDILEARQAGRELAADLGFSSGQLAMIATAISELARNIVNYAGSGEVTLHVVEGASRRGITVVARDQGPGIADIELAMQDGYSSGRSLGLGLPGARRLMDEFAIESTPGEGTTVTMAKWSS